MSEESSFDIKEYQEILNSQNEELIRAKVHEAIEYYKTIESKVSVAYIIKHIFEPLSENMQREFYDEIKSLCDEEVLQYYRFEPYEYEKLWEALKPKIREEKTIDIAISICSTLGKLDVHKLSKFLMDMNENDQNMPNDVIEYCIEKYLQGETFSFESLWKILSKEQQNEYFTKVMFSNFWGLDELWKITNDEVKTERKDEVVQTIIHELTPEAIEKSIEKEEGEFPSRLISILKLVQSGEFKMDIPEDAMEYILKKYSQDGRELGNYVWTHLTKENKEKYLIQFMTANKEQALDIWNSIDERLKIIKFDEVDAIDFSEFPEVDNKIKGYYIDIIKKLSPEDRKTVIEQDKVKFIDALRRKNGLNSDESINEQNKDYSIENACLLLKLDSKKVLNKSNCDTIIKAIPILGEEVVMRTYESNSDMMAGYANQILGVICEEALRSDKQTALKMLAKIEDVFSKDYLPSFYKIYKYFNVVVNQNDKIFWKLDYQSHLSPALKNAKSDSLRNRIIFSDLMKISMDSNNKSFRDFLKTLEDGNKIYVDIMKNGAKFEDLNLKEKQVFTDFTGVLQALYQESGAYSRAEREGRSLTLTGDVVKDAESLGKRYSADGKIEDLPDRVLKTYIGPYQELFAGITTVAQMREYVDNKTKTSNKRHRELAGKKIDLQTGEMVKGIQIFDMKILKSILQDGVRAGEFLGTSNHSDATPLDTDFGMYVDSDKVKDKSLLGKIKSTPAGRYGKVYIVLKKDSNKMEYTRVNENTSPEIKAEDETTATRIADKNKPEEAKKRNDARTTGEYQTSRYEVFSSVIGKSHYGVRTGVGSTDIDYIVIDTAYDKRIGYELAMNGTYIPIVDAKTEKVLFTPEQYEKIREQMRGLSYYDAEDFKVSDTAFIPMAKMISKSMFKDGNPEDSKRARGVVKKREAIEQAVEKAMARIGLRVEKEITGDLSNGFVELIDTGSTGRNTNKPRSGDFDFTLKVDRNIMENPERLKRLKEELVKELAHPVDEDSKIEYAGSGDFRYKKVKIEGLKNPVDIDITFMSKDERVKFSTDMCVRERLENIKATDPEGYKCTIANIILAKTLLSDEDVGLYKKHGSPGASELGGLGGVGIENWILQNGGSFVDALSSFLEASKQAEQEAREVMPDGDEETVLAEEFKRMKNIYPIFDFGQNHRSNNYEHDSFINGLTEAGYYVMKNLCEEMIQELMPERTTTTLRESFLADAKQITEDRTMGNIEGVQKELMQTKDDKQLKGEKEEKKNNPSIV